MSDTIVIIVIILLLIFVGVIIGASLLEDKAKIAHQVELAIEACEANLPRNQHCEPVYSARIITND